MLWWSAHFPTCFKVQPQVAFPHIDTWASQVSQVVQDLLDLLVSKYNNVTLTYTSNFLARWISMSQLFWYVAWYKNQGHDTFLIRRHRQHLRMIPRIGFLSSGLFHQWGYPNSWMVYVRENPTKIRMIWGHPHSRKPPYSCRNFHIVMGNSDRLVFYFMKFPKHGWLKKGGGTPRTSKKLHNYIIPVYFGKPPCKTSI